MLYRKLFGKEMGLERTLLLQKHGRVEMVVYITIQANNSKPSKDMCLYDCTNSQTTVVRLMLGLTEAVGGLYNVPTVDDYSCR